MKKYTFGICVLFTFLLLIVFSGGPAFSQEATQHKVEPGDTLSKLSEKYLGDTKYWHELVVFNGLPENIGPNEVPAREIILIPGVVRTNALSALNKAREARARALAAKANEFGKESFQKAEGSYRIAEDSFKNTRYANASAMAAVASERFVESVSIADREAVRSLSIELVAPYGDVKYQNGGKRQWENAGEDAKMLPGDRLQTGDNSGVMLRFRDRSLLNIRGKSEIVLATYSNDLRTDKTIINMNFESGTIDGFVKTQQVKGSSFTINSGNNSFNLSGVEFFLAYKSDGSIAFSVFSGEGNVIKGGTDPIPVRANKGLVITKEGDIQVSQGLLAAPKTSTPKNNGTSFNQKPELEWHKALGVTQYRIQLSDDVDFMHLIDDVYTSRLNFTTSILDVGKYFWRVSSVDQIGLMGPPGQTWTFFIKRNLDLTIKPSDTLLVKKLPFANTNHQFNIFPTQQENSVDWIEVSIDDAGFKRLERPIQFNTEGEHVIKYRAVDVKNERQPLDEYRVIVDSTKPEVSITANKAVIKVGADVYAPITHKFGGAAKDELGGVKAILVKRDDGEFRDETPERYRNRYEKQIYSSWFGFTKDGLHTITVKAQDIAGNWSEEKTLKIFIDSVPPDVEIRPADIVIQGKDSTIVSGKCQFFFDVNDDISGTDHVLASVDGSEFSKVTVGSPFGPLQGGRHVIQYRAVDKVGNISPIKAFTVDIDNLPPKTVWKTKPALVNFRGNLYGPKGIQLSFAPRDNLSGIENVDLDINDDMLPGVVKGEREAMKFVKEGTYRLTFFSVDKVRNAEDPQDLVFTVDGTAPTVDLSIAGPRHEAMAKLYISEKSTMHISAKDEVSGTSQIQLSKNGEEPLVFQGPITGLPQGAFHITYWAIDNVGNKSDKKEIRITVDNTAPTVWVEKNNEGAYVIRALDDLSGVHEIFARVDGGKLQRYKDKDVLPQGKNVTYHAVDNVGNETPRQEKILN